MNGLTRSAAYLAVAVLAGLLASWLLWPAAFAASGFGDSHPLADWLGKVAQLCAGLLLVRLVYLAIFGASWRTRFLAATVLGCLAAAYAFVGVVLLVSNPAGSGVS